MKKITVQEYNTPSGPRWVVARHYLGRKTRSFFKTKREAEEEASIQRALEVTSGQQIEGQSANQKILLRQALAKCEADGIDLLALLTNAKPPAAAPVASKSPSVSKVLKDLIDGKKADGLSHARVYTLGLTLGAFAKGREEQRISDIDTNQVSQYLRTKNLASRKTLRSHLSTLFNFAIKRDYIKVNPCAKLDKIKYSGPEKIEFMTTDQVLTAIDALLAVRHNPLKGLPDITYKHAAAWFVLGTLCGLRPDEAKQIHKSAINIDDGTIRIDKAITKVRSSRIVYPRPEALAVLKLCLPDARMPLSVESKKRVIHYLRKNLGLAKWPKDFTRHTAASMWLAVSKDRARLAEDLGTSEQMLKKHYLALVSIKDGEAFWAAMGAKALQLGYQPDAKLLKVAF